MTQRPHSVTVIGALFIAAGAVGLAYHATELKAWQLFPYEPVWVCLVRLLAVAFGFFLLRGHNWARWGALVWLAWHVVLGALHSLEGLVIHALLLVVIGCFLPRPRVNAYFRRARIVPAPMPETHERPAVCRTIEGPRESLPLLENAHLPAGPRPVTMRLAAVAKWKACTFRAGGGC